MQLAPIVLFVYNRPWHTWETLSALSRNDIAAASTLIVYCDGPTQAATHEENERIAMTRRIVNGFSSFAALEVIEREHNLGLAENIKAGVSTVVNRYGRIIVLEDDIVTQPGFLRFMNDALELYKDDPEVMHISGYAYPIDYCFSGRATYFLKVLSCWGWATWKRAWDHYDDDVDDHVAFFSAKKSRVRAFNIEGGARFFDQLLANKDRRLNTWAVRWYASWLRAGGISLFPVRSLVRNIGHDGTGAHCSAKAVYETTLSAFETVDTIEPGEDIHARRRADKFFRERVSGQISTKKSSSEYLAEMADRVKSSIRSISRRLLLLVFPELRPLFRQPLAWDVLAASRFRVSLAANARLNKPYTIANSTVGRFSYIGRGAIITQTTIGAFCSIGPNFFCGWGRHPLAGISTAPMFYSTRGQNGVTLASVDKYAERSAITIGNDVFIGANVTVLDGRAIGDGAVIGAGAVVSKDIPPYAIAVGAPIRIIGYRFDQPTISRFLRIRWWDFTTDQLKDVERKFFEVEEFLKKYEELLQSDRPE